MGLDRNAAVALGILFACAGATPVAADEGMWPFDRFPKDAVHQKYGFEVTQQFLDGLRLATVRIGGGSGAFVSPQGLLLTDRRAVSGCLAQLASAGHDYAKDGFYAASQPAEARCTGLEAGVLTDMADVTKQVKAAAREGAPPAKALQARGAEIARIEKDCTRPPEQTCSVVTLFSGGLYSLNRYRVYADVRLVFAPEYQVAFFGAERDSITYLRYGLNIAFLRVYENGQPAATAHYLKWSTAGVKEGGLVFAVGDPAATARATTAAQLTFYRDTALPAALARLGPRIQQLNTFAAQPVLNDLLESYKSDAGRLIGLRDDRLVLRKTVFDAKIRQAVERDPALGKDGGKVWDQVAAAYKTWAPFEKPYQILEGSPAPGSNLFRIARQLVRGEPPADTEASIGNAVETVLLTQYLEELKSLKGKDALPKSILNGQTPRQAAEALVQSTRLNHPAERRRLAADHNAVMSSDDAMIHLVLLLEDPARRLRKKREDVIGSLKPPLRKRSRSTAISCSAMRNIRMPPSLHAWSLALSKVIPIAPRCPSRTPRHLAVCTIARTARRLTRRRKDGSTVRRR